MSVWKLRAYREGGGKTVRRHTEHDSGSVRTGGRADAGEGVLELDVISRELRYLGKSVRLSPAQASVMVLLMRAAPAVVPADAIWTAVRAYVPTRRTWAVRVLVHCLRQGCRQTFGDKLIETVHGTGYRVRA